MSALPSRALRPGRRGGAGQANGTLPRLGRNVANPTSWCDGVRLQPSTCTELSDAIVGLNGLPPRPLGYRQCRVLGAVALDLCLVAAGVLDGYIDTVDEAHGVWDYLASVMICREAGVEVADLHGRNLAVLDHSARRTPIAGATAQLFDQLLVARQQIR